MSWNRSYPSRVAFIAAEPSHSSSWPTEEQKAAGKEPVVSDHEADQVSVARSAAVVIMDSHAVGNPDMDFTINISGHANPGHVPDRGMANDTITVSVSQK